MVRTGGLAVPKTVKAFAWLSALYVLFGAALLAWSLYYAPPGLAHLFARLPAQMRDAIFHAQFESASRAFVLHTAVFLILAGTAAFARQDWARWLLLVYLLLTLFGPVATAAIQHHGFGSWAVQYLQQRWLQPLLDWPVYVGTVLKIALLVLVFAPASRPWFRTAAVTCMARRRPAVQTATAWCSR